MTDSLYLAWRYIAYHKIKTTVLVVAITLILYLPVALKTVVRSCDQQLMARAVSTPLILGAKGSSLDLAIATLYFEPKAVEAMSMSEVDRVDETGLALAIPVYTRFQARKHTIVGTTLEYFEFRGLRIAQGRQITCLGECVLGALAAGQLDLKPGDHLISSPEAIFDLAGTYPLKMRVAGTLERSHTPDDLAVFVDIKTAWVIQGLGHGHQDLTKVSNPDILLKRERDKVTASAKLVQYNEINDDNIDSFHFHGTTSDFPITAVIAVPPNQKSQDLLRGRYQTPEGTSQIIRPIDVIRGLTATIFKVEGVLNSAFVLVGVATVLLVLLVIMLSLRLRHREVQTMIKLGCSRMKIAGMLSCELVIIVLISLSLTSLASTITSFYVDEILRVMIL
jgi:putative ABC transport system permease protein